MTTPAQQRGAANALMNDVPTRSGGLATHPKYGGAPLTDAGNAEVLAEMYRGLICYDHAHARWLVWGRHRWKPDDDGAVERMALQAVRKRRAATLELDGDDSTALFVHAIRSEAAPRLAALLRVARSLSGIAVTGRDWDTGPGVVGAPNGVIELRTGELRPGRPEDRITKHVGTEYNREAKCPRFEKFLQDVTDGDEDVIRYLQRLAGYTLTGEGSLAILLFLKGNGRNGKSQFLNILEWLFADYAQDLSAHALTDEKRGAHTTEIRDLEGSRLATSKEVSEQKLNAPRLKQLSGTDGVTARHLYQDNETFPQSWQLWLMTNYNPRITDAGASIVDRITVVNFPRQFKRDDPATVPNLAREIWDEEAEGILAWAVRGAADFYREGLGDMPQAVREATNEYLEEIDPIQPMISSGHLVEDPEAFSSTENLYLFGYRMYAGDREIPDAYRLSEDGFAKRLSDRFEKARRTINGQKVRGFKGVRTKTLVEMMDDE